MKKIVGTCALIAATLLTACGGGGGGNNDNNNTSATVTSTDTFAFKSAWGTYIRQGFTKSFSVSGSASNAIAGSFPLTGSGTVTQISTEGVDFTPFGATESVKAIKVERNYVLTAIANGLAIPQTLKTVDYYDSVDFHYLGGTLTDNTGATRDNLLQSWSPLADTLTCCQPTASPFYSTTAVPGGTVASAVGYSTGQDKAHSIFVYMGDSGHTPGPQRTYRLSADGLAPFFESIKAVATVLTTKGTFVFDVNAQFLY